MRRGRLGTDTPTVERENGHTRKSPRNRMQISSAVRVVSESREVVGDVSEGEWTSKNGTEVGPSVGWVEVLGRLRGGDASSGRDYRGWGGVGSTERETLEGHTGKDGYPTTLFVLGRLPSSSDREYRPCDRTRPSPRVVPVCHSLRVSV